MSFRINKSKKPVTLFLAGRSPMTGHFFLSDYSERHHGAERVMDLLSGDDTFVPFESEDGRFWMVQKVNIMKVIVDAGFELEIIRSYGEDAMISKTVTVNMNDGHEEHGVLLIEPREGASRVIDEINRGKGFFSLVVGDRVHVLGLPFVVTLRESA